MGNSRFSDGFLIGALVGGAVVFLFATKKGNKVLKAISENGIDGLTDIFETIQEREVVPRAIKKTEDIARDFVETVEDKINPEPLKPNGHSKKRFFRKSK